MLGSQAYVDGLSADELGALTGYLNADMLGSPNGGYFVYDDDPALEQVLYDGLAAQGVQGAPETGADGRSDHTAFAAAGVPVGGLFSGAGADQVRAGGAAVGRHGRRAVRPLLPRVLRRPGQRRPRTSSTRWPTLSRTRSGRSPSRPPVARAVAQAAAGLLTRSGHDGRADPRRSGQTRRHGPPAGRRRRGSDPAGDGRTSELERVLLEPALTTAQDGATVCPSEVARAVGTEDSWRDLMEPARRAARRLVASGEVEITQGGKVVDPSTATGRPGCGRRADYPLSSPTPGGTTRCHARGTIVHRRTAAAR